MSRKKSKRKRPKKVIPVKPESKEQESKEPDTNEQDNNDVIVSIDHSKSLLEIGTRRSNYTNQIIKIALNETEPYHWFNESGSPYLMVTGCLKIMRRLKLIAFELKAEPPEQLNDELGSYYLFTTQGKVGQSRLEYLEVFGTATTRDAFFAKKYGVLKPQSDINVGDVKQASYSNFIVNGVTRFLGIKGLSWDVIEKLTSHKINSKNVDGYNKNDKKNNSGYTPTKPPKKNPTRDDVIKDPKLVYTMSDDLKAYFKERIREIILLECKNDHNEARNKLMNLTTYKSGDTTFNGTTSMRTVSSANLYKLIKHFSTKLRKDTK
jgi:hypothetical protein